MEIREKYRQLADNVLNGDNNVEAYQKIFPNAKPSTAKINGFRILRRPEVKEYILSRQQELAEKSVINREKQLARLEKLLGKTKSTVTKIKILQEENKLLGLYAPVETKNKNINSEVPLNDEERAALESITNEFVSA